MSDKPPGKKNPLIDFTGPECEYFRQHCNFTPLELEIFNLRSRDWSVAHAAMELHVCERTINRKTKSILRKIYNVL